MAHTITRRSWVNQNILSIEQFDLEALKELIDVANEMKTIVTTQGTCELLKGKILANVFFEPSTRTSCSFHAAMLRLGGSVIPINESSSSAQKGEALSDTIRCLECYADIIVLRHPIQGSAMIAAQATDKPVINAGDGIGEHPTQALLDLYTIVSEMGTFDLAGKVITMIGDLKHGRTVHSLAKLLAFFHVKLLYLSPESLEMPSYIIEDIQALGIEQSVITTLEDAIPRSDVLYVTRIQKERFNSMKDYEAVKDSFRISLSSLVNAKSTLLILHPLPRVNEIAEEVDRDPRAVYFRQMKYGMYIRMALLALVLGKSKKLEH